MKTKTKTKVGKRVSHLGKKWTVLGREYDPRSSHSYYLLKDGKKTKWTRADKFAVV